MANTNVSAGSAAVDTDALLGAWNPAFPAAWAVPVAAATLFDTAREMAPVLRSPVGKLSAPRGKGQGDYLERLRCPVHRPDEPSVAVRSRRDDLGNWLGFETVPVAPECTCARIDRPGGVQREGRQFYIRVTPGGIRVLRRDQLREDRNADRVASASAKRVHEGSQWLLQGIQSDAEETLARLGLIDQVDVLDRGGDPLRPVGRSKISKWSAKSRLNMVETLCSLDYSPLLREGRTPAMVTLTLPGAWEVVAPTGAAFKALVRAFQERWFRATGERLAGVWKLEFQRRGAPHLHILCAPPARVGQLPFREWLSAVWADVVAHPDLVERMKHEQAGTGVDYNEGLRAKDPKRVAVYFLKHNNAGGKEYQHVVPELWRAPGAGPGRFWGVWGLAPLVADVPVTYDQAVKASRVLRRWQESKRGVRLVRVVRGCSRHTGEIRWRTVRRRVRRMPSTWGFLACNDGPAAALLLASALRV